MPDPVAPPRNAAMAVAATALKAQQSRMRVIAENIANAESTAQVAGGQPYRRQVPVFQAREVDGSTLPHHLLAGPGAALLRRHVQHLHEHRPRGLPRVLQALRRFRLLEEGEQAPDLAQALGPVVGIRPHAAGHALRRAEQVAEHGNGPAPRRAEVAPGVLEEGGRAPGLQNPVEQPVNPGARVHAGAHALELAGFLQLRDEVAQVAIGHRGILANA